MTTTTEQATASAPETRPKGKRRKARGTGSLYQRGETWWIVYFDHGRRYRESSKSTVRGDAVDLLKKRLAECGKGRRVNPTDEARVTMTELFDALKVDYQNNGRRSAATLAYRLKPLTDAFGKDRALAVTETRIEDYKARRLTAGAAPATINRELSALRRAFRLAVRQRRLSSAPGFDLLAEHNARQGFLEPATFEAVVSQLPDYLRDAARLAYLTGWRKGEVSTLAWSDVDRAAGRITLRSEHSKNGEPRVLPLTGELAALIERRWEARDYKAPDGRKGIARLVFHRKGQPLGDFRKAWASACIAAGFCRAKTDENGRPALDRKGQPVMESALLFHDMRRSAVRNFDRAGVGQAVAMKITGHKTASVYRRYRIVNEDDMRAALERASAAPASSPNVVRLRVAERANG